MYWETDLLFELSLLGYNARQPIDMPTFLTYFPPGYRPIAMYAEAGIEAARVKAYQHTAPVDKGITTSLNSNKVLSL